MELYGRRVVDVEVDGVDSRDYPDFCDAHFSHAVFSNTGKQLSDSELDQLQNAYPEVLWQMASDFYMARAI